MSCKFNAPNGKQSKLYDDLYKRFGANTAVKNYAVIRTQEFIDWFGVNWMEESADKKIVDENGEPALNEFNEFTNINDDNWIINVVKRSSVNDAMSVDDMLNQIAELTEVFKQQADLDVNVEFDGDLLDVGSVITINGKTQIKFNPRKVQKDSVFHEFGHIYIDMLGVNHPVVSRGIDHLRDSELWNKIEKTYPELSEEMLAKEVLTTAIGIEAAKDYDQRVALRNESKKSLLNKIRAWKFWVNHFFNEIGKLLGLNQNDVKRLARNLTSKNLKYTLTGKPSSFIQKQKSHKSLEDYIEKSNNRTALSKDESAYEIDGDPNRRLRRTTEALEDLKGKFDKEAAITRVVSSKKPEYEDYSTREDVMKLWADKREEGTGLHKINEDYINQRNAGATREEAIQFTLDNLFTPEKQGELDEDGVRFYSGMKRELAENYIDQIANFLESLYAKGYKLYPEVRVFDEEMGVAGTIDLIVKKPDNSLMIYDFKTKEVGKFNKFYTKNKWKPTLQGVMSHINNTTANGYSLQLSTYKLILERNGFKVDKLAIIPFEGKITVENDEYRYEGVKLYEDHVTKKDPDGVLPLNSLSEDLKNFFEIQDDTEAILENVEERNETLNEMMENLIDLHDTREWLNQVIVDLQKSISRISATADPDQARRYETSIKNLIEKLDVEDEMHAIAAYTEFVSQRLSQLYGKFFDDFQIREDENGKKYRVYVKGYENLTWAEIKEMEQTTPKKYMEFLSFMVGADMFLEQIVNIQKLPFTNTKQASIVIKALKQNEIMVSDLRLKLNRLNKELDTRYIELSSNPLYGGRGVIDNTAEFFKAQTDESFTQRWMDALADTHNGYMANIVRMYDYKMRAMEDEVKEVSFMWNKAVKDLEEAGSNLDRFIDKDTARLISPTNTQKYYEDRSKMYDFAKKKFGIGTKAWRKYVNNWFAVNSKKLDKDARIALNKKMKKELGAEGFKDWLNKQTYVNKKGQRKDSNVGAYYVPHPDKYSNSRFDALTDKEKEFHKFLTNTFAYLSEHMKDSIVKSGYLPAVPKNEKSFSEEMAAAAGWKDSSKYDANQGVIVNEAGEVVHFLPFRYSNFLSQEKTERITKDMDEVTKRDINARNKEIRKKNKTLHAARVNQDLKMTMPAFIREAIKHKHKKAMEFEVLRVRKSFIENHKIAVMKGGKRVVDKFKKFAGLENNTVEKGSIDSNLLKHYEDWLRMVFYEQFENDEGSLQKVARVLQNYTSFKGMALNVLSAINNQTYGALMSNIEAGAAQFFGKGDWFSATGMYTTGITSYFSRNEESDDFGTKQAAFIDHFDVLMDFKELAVNENQNQAMASKALRRSSWLLSKAYALEHASEHNLQNRVLFAMAKSHRLIDGEFMTLQDFLRGKIKKFKPNEVSAKEAREIMAANKKLKKELTERFRKYETVYDSFDFSEGRLKLKEGAKINKNEIAEFQRRVIGVNQYLHGIYNKEDAGAMQQYALGRLAIQFRKWMRPGWNKRFGAQFGKEYWNERRSVMEEGMYTTTAKFFATPILDNWQKWRNPEGEKEIKSVIQFIGNILRDYGRFFGRIKVHWHTLTDAQQSNVIRTMLEYLAFSSMIGILYLLKNIKGEDDDPPLALMLLIYQADRTATELTTYVPMAATVGYVGGGWLNETKKILKSPTATFNTLESAIKISQSLIYYPFQAPEDRVYKGGVYSGQSRINTQIKKMIPIFNQFHRWNYLSKNYKYYKLF